MTDAKTPGFSTGQTVATPGALRALNEAGITPLSLILRHMNHDYGDIDAGDIEANRQAILDGSRIFSAYEIVDGVRLFVITEAEQINAAGTRFRASTCIMLDREY